MLSSARSVGVIGSILTLVFFIPVFGTILSIIGWVLIIVAVNQISQMIDERKVLNDVLIAAALSVAGIASSAFVLLGSLFHFFNLNGYSGYVPFVRVNGSYFMSGTTHGLGGLVLGVVAGLVLLCLFLVGSSIFLRRGYDRIATRLNVGMFSTTALVYLVGAVLTVFVIGLAIIFVAEILQTIAFFSLPDEVPGQAQNPVPMTVPPPPPSTS